MDQEFRPVDQSVVNLGERFLVVLRQLDAFPQLAGHVRALNGLHVEVEGARVGVGADGSITRVREGAGLAIAEAGDIVLISAEVLLFRSPGTIRMELRGERGWRAYLSLKEQNCWLMTCQTISSEDMTMVDCT